MVLFLWAFYAASVITLLPIWEGRHSIRAFLKFMFETKSKRAADTAAITHGLDLNTVHGEAEINRAAEMNRCPDEKKVEEEGLEKMST